MNLENIELFIKSGVATYKKEQYKSFIVASWIVGILGSTIASFLTQLVSMYSMVPILISIASIVGVYLLSEKTLSTQNRLILQTVINGNWVIQFLFLAVVLFIMQFGVNIFLCFLFIPPILTPSLIAFCVHRSLKKGAFTLKKFNRSKYIITPFMTGAVGLPLGAILFKNSSQKTAILIAIILLTLLCTIFSVGLLSTQRIYYLRRFQLKEKSHCN